MDDFSLTNSNCELSLREIPRVRGRAEPAAFRLSIFFPRAVRSGALINYHRRLKLYCRRSLGRAPRVDCKRRTHGDRKFPSSSFVRKFSRHIATWYRCAGEGGRGGLVNFENGKRSKMASCSLFSDMPILKSRARTSGCYRGR